MATEGPAAAAGLRRGDCIVRIGDAEPIDLLDLDWAAADGALDLEVERDGGRRRLHIALGAGEWHGIELIGGLGDDIRGCANQCLFCFVDQMPVGLRPSLYVKDDDYRLSFLQGNFITLSNMAEHDLRRVEHLRLSPLYVSLHAWDDAARVALMGKAVGPTRERLLRLAQAGIELHIQVVLCPGHNDGELLRQTIHELAAVQGIADVGVVPVSLIAEGSLRRVTGADASAAVDLIEALQPGIEGRLGRRFVHAADELYLLAGREPSPADAPQQYENGIGLSAAFLDEARAIGRSRQAGGDTRPPVALLTGTLAVPVVAAAAGLMGAARPFVVENRLFGDHVTVTGLLGGRDVLRALTAGPLDTDEWLLAPRSFLPEELGRTLDDVAEAELRAACGGRLHVGDGLAAAFATLPGP